MNLRIKTKWGLIVIDPERIYEVNVKLNTYENKYRIDFVLDNFHTQSVDLSDMNELGAVMRRITNDLQFVKQYKFKDATGRIQFDEPARTAAFKQKKDEESAGEK